MPKAENSTAIRRGSKNGRQGTDLWVILFDASNCRRVGQSGQRHRVVPQDMIIGGVSVVEIAHLLRDLTLFPNART